MEKGDGEVNITFANNMVHSQLIYGFQGTKTREYFNPIKDYTPD